MWYIQLTNGLVELWCGHEYIGEMTKDEARDLGALVL